MALTAQDRSQTAALASARVGRAACMHTRAGELIDKAQCHRWSGHGVALPMGGPLHSPAFRPAPAKNQQAPMIMVSCRGKGRWRGQLNRVANGCSYEWMMLRMPKCGRCAADRPLADTATHSPPSWGGWYPCGTPCGQSGG